MAPDANAPPATAPAAAPAAMDFFFPEEPGFPLEERDPEEPHDFGFQDLGFQEFLPLEDVPFPLEERDDPDPDPDLEEDDLEDLELADPLLDDPEEVEDEPLLDLSHPLTLPLSESAC